jgi:hypothetical protein
MPNFALPEQMFFHHTKSWAPQSQTQPLLYLPVPAGDYEAKFVPILWLLKNMKVVACVERDFKNLDKNIKLIYLKWLRVSPPASRTVGSSRWRRWDSFVTAG